MIFNLIHRPCGHFECYDFQRECAHSLNLKATVMIPTKQLTNEKVIALSKEDHEKYNDELGIWIEPMADMPNTQVWLLNTQDKERCVKYSIDKFFEIFGFYPKCVGNYVLDAQIMKMITDYCPTITTVVAGCFEEGVKVFHGCNNSWYLFSEGMSWNAWYPSKTHSVRPAKNKEDWAGVVAVPHLSRDMVLGYEGRNDFFASHPANIQRGLANEGYTHCYDFNLVDQFRLQEDYNDGFSYYQMHVGPGWFDNNFNIIDSNDITRTLYKETLEYLKELRDNGNVTDMHLSEFGEYYKKNVPLEKDNIGVGKDILFGSGKHYFWILNPDYRALVDTFQGGSIGDLRPYIAEYETFTGVDSDNLLINSYPYIIQSQYRSGYKNHHEDGSRTTLLAEHNGEVLDMCCYPTKIENVERFSDKSVLTLTPVTMTFKDGLEIKIQTIYSFLKDGKIEITRKLLSAAEVNLTEYVKACYGFIEYPENMKGITFLTDGDVAADYAYNSKAYNAKHSVSAIIPQINTEISLEDANKKAEMAEIVDGHLFSPFFTMKLKYNISKNDKEVTSCLILKKTKA